MSGLQTFKNELFEVAAKYDNDQVLFDVEQVAICLGITDEKNGKQYVRWSRVNGYMPINSPLVAKGDFISEPLVYKLAFKASNEVAEKFQDWLAIEVIPSIRKHGAYMTEQVLEKAVTDPDFMIGLLTNLKEEKKKRVELELAHKQKDQIIGELKPKADYTDTILKSKGVVTITQIAKDYGMSGQEMNELLRDLKVQYKQSEQWLLYSKYHKKGYTHSETINFTRGDGRSDVKMNTKWTQKGRLFIYELLKSEGVLPLIEQKIEDVSV